jgi:hypothetical protein
MRTGTAARYIDNFTGKVRNGFDKVKRKVNAGAVSNGDGPLCGSCLPDPRSPTVPSTVR